MQRTVQNAVTHNEGDTVWNSFMRCRLLNYFVHGTIPRYSFFYCSFCLPLHFEISKQFFLLPIISFMKLSNNSFGLLRFSLQSLNLFSYDIWNCII